MDDYFDRVETQLGQLVERGAHRRGGSLSLPRLPRIRLGAVALVGSSALALVIAAIVLVSAHRNHPPQPSGAGVGAGQVDPSLVSNYRILRRPLTSAGRLPAGFAVGGIAGVERGQFGRSSMWITSEPGPPTMASIGLLPTLTQRTTIPGTTITAWLIPGRHGMCWFTEGGPFPTFPNPAVCVGTLAHPAAALIDGPWTDVESADRAIIGLVTDRVRAVMLVDGSGRGHRVPLSEGFYVSPLPTGRERLVAVTRGGVEPLYPQRLPPLPRGLGSAGKVIARSARPEAVLTGTRGLRVQLMSEMTCGTRRAFTGGIGISTGNQHQAAYEIPAVVPLSFPRGSRSEPLCYVTVTTQAGPGTRGAAHVTIIAR